MAYVGTALFCVVVYKTFRLLFDAVVYVNAQRRPVELVPENAAYGDFPFVPAERVVQRG